MEWSFFVTTSMEVWVMSVSEHTGTIELPGPKHDSEISIEKTLLKRRSVRSFRDEPLTLEETSQLLWSAQGITNQRGYRAAPSAGALYPLELYVAAGKVKQIAQGLYRYRPHKHALGKTQDGDIRAALSSASLGQSSVRNAPLVVILCAVYMRITSKYGERGIRYTHIEVGHAAQNISLQAISLGLGSVMIGAFRDEEVRSVLKLGADEDPLYIIPIGRGSR